jgi:single-strand DNA-binding protein
MYQQIIVIGNLGRDPEMRYMPDGTAVTNMSLASNKSWTDQATGEARKVTTWFNVSVWGKQAESVAEYMKKGSPVLVVGELQPDKETGAPRLWTAQDGSVRASYDLKSFNVKFLPGKAEGSDGGYGGEGVYESTAPEEEDEIPF